MKTITASDFELRCLELIAWVNVTGKEIVVTKRGIPIVVLQKFRELAGKSDQPADTN